MFIKCPWIVSVEIIEEKKHSKCLMAWVSATKQVLHVLYTCTNNNNNIHKNNIHWNKFSHENNEN